MDTDRFDVTAKAPSGATQIGMRKMLQNLLADRFHLAIKNEEKPVPTFVLTLVKKGVAKRSAGTGDLDCKRSVDEGVISLTCHNVTMASLAERLPGAAPGYFSMATVDHTGLTGRLRLSIALGGAPANCV